MSRMSNAISMDHVSVSYAGTDPLSFALQRVSLNVAKGSWTAIVGANGSGKSTLVKAIAGLCGPTEGCVTIAEGECVHVVMQNPETQILGDTVFEEISLSLRDAETPDRRSAVHSILEEAGLRLALETPTGRLSGGEMQRLNIASCIAAGATIFVLDEVTSMLDHASRDLVLQSVRRLHDKGATILWCTHRSEELGFAERVIVLDKGRVSYDGSSRHFLYGDRGDDVSPCEHWGMELPYVVQVAKQLEKRGYSLGALPLLPRELGEAVREKCRST